MLPLFSLMICLHFLKQGFPKITSLYNTSHSLKPFKESIKDYKIYSEILGLPETS
ncbi:hypothetical protein NEOC65_000833 [Neochlamydia sp. AcF65]|nr:hypothetical protein [Neochlamydia sp. AcF65]